eukprot:4923730-Pleurochrysis_carterae.AAC.13
MSFDLHRTAKVGWPALIGPIKNRVRFLSHGAARRNGATARRTAASMRNVLPCSALLTLERLV